jgi:hypothetical protein
MEGAPDNYSGQETRAENERKDNDGYQPPP